MSSANTENKQCIDIPDLAKFLAGEGQKGLDHWYEAWLPNTEASKAVVKIVLGQLGKDKSQPGTLPKQLKDRFPNLTHLHLWGLELSESLPDLHPGLLCLDIRAAAALEKLPILPANLEQLILEDNPKLADVQLAGEAQALWDLSLRGCGLLGDAVLGHLLERTPNLRRLDASELALLTGIPAWPVHLERIDLDRCTALTGLPEQWPPKLRRLGLRGASSLRVLPDFEDWPDYLDLAGAAGLTKLQQPKSGRTLFLYGSGVRVPPASEHGENASENVAQRVRDYYADCELLGRGKVNRCKLLVLGNGSAGKTCLSAALVPEGDPNLADKLGSTHGIQFWPWQLRGIDLPESKLKANVDVHIWDFGGQEIYHQTHKLFMAKGAVFLIAWNPDQEGMQPAPTPDGFQDTYRPIEYWVDLVHQACPWNPRIAVVRTHSSEWKPKERERLESLAAKRDIEIGMFAADSKASGEPIDRIRVWVKQSVAHVVETQGTAVPAHWEIAQELVESWFPAAAPGVPIAADSPTHLTIPRNEFLEEFERAVHAAIAKRGMVKLRRALEADPACLGGGRLDRLLDFLTHSGWVYWDPKLFEEQIIVSQRWALDGIYTALDRRKNTEVYRKLLDLKGVFTRKTLEDLVWAKAGLPIQQQELLLSFMLQAGVAVRLIKAEESILEQATYLSLEHLPTSVELGLESLMKEQFGVQKRDLVSDGAHRSHWNAILAGFAAHYGRDGRYARDGFLLESGTGSLQCVRFGLDKESGLGATVVVEVVGEDATEQLKRVVAFIEDRLPRDPLDPPKGGALEERRKGQSHKPTLFVSYAWNPGANQEGLVEAGVTPDYEAPVDRVEQLLSQYSSLVNLDRDRLKIQSGESITAFISLVIKDDFVLVVHSDKYWRSWYCMAEVTRMLDASRNKETAIFKRIALFVEHPTSRLGDESARRANAAYWRNVELKSFPPCMIDLSKGSFEAEQARNVSFFEKDLAEIHSTARKYKWDPARPEAFDRWLKQQLAEMGLKFEG
jgi:internalin A